MRQICFVIIGVAIGCQPSFAQKQSTIENVVKRFVSPGSTITQLMTEVDPQTKQGHSYSPAVLSARLEDGSDDIAFAETSTLDAGRQVLVVNILKPYQNGYIKVFSKTYYDRVFFGQNFKTIGFSSVRLSADTNGLLVLTSAGAALGGDLEIFAWKDGLGFLNIVPANVNGGHQFTWDDEDGVLVVHISYRKSSTDVTAAPPTTLRWSAEAGTMLTVP